MLQVLTSEQYAIGLVYAYPHVPGHKRWLEVLAAQEGEPGIQDLILNESLDDEQHVANWDVAVDYLSSLTVEQKGQHVPLPR